MNLARLSLAAALASCTAPIAWTRAYTCSVIPFTDFAPESESPFAPAFPTGVNSSGQMVATYQTCSGPLTCVDHGILRTIGGPSIAIEYPGSVGTSARSVNDAGVVAGSYTDAPGLSHGYLRRSDGTYVSIEPPAEYAGYSLELWGLNNNGDLLGVLTGGESNSTALSFVRDTAGNFTTFPWRTSGSSGLVRTGSINNSRDFVLWGDGAIYHADGTRSDLSHPFANLRAVYGLNDGGEVTAAASYLNPTDELPLLRTASGNFTGFDCPEALAAGEFGFEWSPTAISSNGLVAGVVRDRSGNRVMFLGTPLPGEPHWQQSKTRLDFPLIPVNSTAEQTFEISNSGTAPLSLRHAFSTDRQEFTLTKRSCGMEVPAAGTCELTVVYHPFTDAPASHGTLVISDNSPDAPHTLELSGSARPQRYRPSVESWTFGVHPVGEVVRLGSLWIYNEGPENATVSGAEFRFGEASDFQIVNNSCSGAFPAYHTCLLTFQFTPMGIGPRSSTLVVTFDRPSTSYSASIAIDVNGTGGGRALRFSSESWTFSPNPVGVVGGTGTLWVYNSGTDPVNFAPAAITGANSSDFAVTSDSCRPALTPYHTCQVTFVFKPTAPGYRTATLSVANDVSGGLQAIPISGTGN